jgi:hypothetical protein
MYAATLLSILFSGCGLRVPDISESGNATDSQILVQDILTNVTCEMREAFARLQKAHPGGTFLDSWGVQTTLTLTHDEKGSFAPSALWSPIGSATSLFTLAGGIDLSADATRTNKINAFSLRGRSAPPDFVRTVRCCCRATSNSRSGSSRRSAR